MVATVINSWSANVPNSSSATVTVGAINVNSVLIAILIKSGITATTPPAGWISVSGNTVATGRFEVWKKDATSSEPISYTWTGDTQDYIACVYEVYKGDFDTVSIPFINSENSNSPSIPQQDDTSRPGASLRLTGYVSDADAGTKSLAAGHTLLDSLLSTGALPVSLISGWAHHLNTRFAYKSVISKPYRITDTLVEGFGASISVSEDGLNMVVGSSYSDWVFTQRIYYNRIYSYDRNSLTSNWGSSSATLEGDPDDGGATGYSTTVNLSGDGLTLVAVAGSLNCVTFTRSSTTQNWTRQATADTTLPSANNLKMTEDALYLVVCSNVTVWSYSRATVTDPWSLYDTYDTSSYGTLGYFSLSGDGLRLANSTQTAGGFLFKRKHILSSWEYVSSNTLRRSLGSAMSDNGYLYFGIYYPGPYVGSRAVNPLTEAASSPPVFTAPSHGSGTQLYTPGGGVIAGAPRKECKTYHATSRFGTDSVDPIGDLEYYLDSFLPFIPAITHASTNIVDNLTFYIDVEEKLFPTPLIIEPEKATIGVEEDVLQVYLYPTGVTDTYEVDETATLTVLAPGVLSNDDYIL